MATKKPKGLGMGLEALLGPRVVDVAVAPVGTDGEPRTLALDQLQPGRYQPRTRMDEGALYELAESIKAQGVMQPVLVRPLGPPGPSGERRFEIIAGERRFRAARLAGLDAVPVLVRDVSDEAAAAMALIENIQREDLNPLEEAHAFERLIGEFRLTHQQVADAVGRSRAAVTNLLRLIDLAPEVGKLVERRELDMGHARALLGLENHRKQTELALLVVKKGLSVRETEALVRRLNHPEGPAKVAGNGAEAGVRDPNVARLESELADKLGAQVQIQHTRTGRGKLVVAYNSLDELDGILSHIQ